MIGCLIFVALLISGLTIYVEIRRLSSKISDLVAQEKSDIATISHMTAHMVTFRASGKNCILAASDIMGLLFYRVIVNASTISRTQILLSRITQVRLFIDGRLQPTSFYSTQPTPQLKATEAANSALADLPVAHIEGLHSLELRMNYLSTDEQEKNLRVPLLHIHPGDPLPPNTLQLIKHAIWWQYFLHYAIQDCKNNLQNPAPQASVS